SEPNGLTQPEPVITTRLRISAAPAKTRRAVLARSLVSKWIGIAMRIASRNPANGIRIGPGHKDRPGTRLHLANASIFVQTAYLSKSLTTGEEGKYQRYFLGRRLRDAEKFGEVRSHAEHGNEETQTGDLP